METPLELTTMCKVWPVVTSMLEACVIRFTAPTWRRPSVVIKLPTRGAENNKELEKIQMCYNKTQRVQC